MKRAIVLFLAILVLGALVGGFAYFQFFVKPEMIRGFITAAGPPPVTVTAEPARLARWVPRLNAIGTLRAIQGIDVAPQVGGVITRINFDSGESVEAGDVLVTLDDSIEQADLKSNLAQLKNAQLDLSRQAELLQRGNTPKTNYDAALARRDSAAAAVDRTRAVIAQKTITAPYSGRLGIRKASLGQYVSPGTPLVTLQNLDPIYVDFSLPEQALTVIAVGQTIEIAADAAPGRIYTGEIQSIDARVDLETRNVLVRGRIQNPQLTLLPGMFANVAVLAGEPEERVTVPRTAISYSLYGDSVYVVVPAPGPAPTPDQAPAADETPASDRPPVPNAEAEATPAAERDPPLIAQRRFVRVGDTREGQIAIAEGVKPGEMVATSGQIKLQPNAAVRIDHTAALIAPPERPKE